MVIMMDCGEVAFRDLFLLHMAHACMVEECTMSYRCRSQMKVGT